MENLVRLGGFQPLGRFQLKVDFNQGGTIKDGTILAVGDGANPVPRCFADGLGMDHRRT